MKKIIAVTAMLIAGINYSMAQTPFVVNTTGGNNWFDCNANVNDNDGDPDSGSFAEGLLRLNKGTHRVMHFNIPGAGPHVIDFSNINPDVCATGVLIDGTTQQDAQGNPLISIKGRGSWVNFLLKGNNDTIQGLNIIGTTEIQGNNNVLRNNYFGTNNTGTAATTINVSSFENIQIKGSASGNIIDNNLISNAQLHGIQIFEQARNNIISNNIIGLDKSGKNPIPNGTDQPPLQNREDVGTAGIKLTNSSGNTIDNNIVSGNNGHGIHLFNSNNNDITNNTVGLDIDGQFGIGNLGEGILVEESSNVSVGTTGNGNLVSSNGNKITNSDSQQRITGHGIEIRKGNFNSVEDNLVGTDFTGNSIIGTDGDSIGNQMNGIYIHEASDNLVQNNVVGGNGFAFQNLLLCNGGADWDKTPSETTCPGGEFLGQKRHGIQIHGNGYYGGTQIIAQRNEVYGNKVGIGVDGVSAIPNRQDAMSLLINADNNIIGGEGAKTNIFVNAEFGVFAQAGSDNNIILGNFIGTTNGNDSHPNNTAGIQIQTGSTDNQVGSPTVPNVIANNNGEAVIVIDDGNGTTGNRIVGNVMNCNSGKGIELIDNGNDEYGPVYINEDPSETVNVVGFSPSAGDQIDIYIKDDCGSTCQEGDGSTAQGKTWVGSVTTILDSKYGTGMGYFEFDPTTFTGVTKTNVLVTATNTDGSTSEFSQCTTVVNCQKPESVSLNQTSGILLCDGSNENITVTVTNKVGASGPFDYSYIWYKDNQELITTTTPTLSVSSEGTYTVKVVEGGDLLDAGCATDATNSVTVTENNTPSGTDITGKFDLCIGEVSSYTASSTNGATYNWTLPGDASITSSPVNVASVDIDWGTVNSGSLDVEAENACGTSSVSIPVTFTEAPIVPVITGETELCQNEIDINYSIGATNNTIEWNIPSEVTTPGSSTNNIVISELNDWTGGDIEVTVSNKCGSESNSLSVDVTTFSTLTVTGLENQSCGEAGQIYSVAGGNVGSTFTWTVPNGATFTENDANANSITVDFGTSSGNVSISVTENNNGCTSPAQTTPVNVYGCGLIAAFSTNTPTVCEDEGIDFNDESSFDETGDEKTWSWDFGSNAVPQTSTDQNPSGVIFAPGTHEVTLTITEGLGSDTEVKSSLITVNPTPEDIEGINGPIELCENTEGSYSIENPNVGSDYSWSISSGSFVDPTQLTGPDNTALDVSFGSSNSTISVVETINGCSGTPASIDVSVIGTPSRPFIDYDVNYTFCGGAELDDDSTYTFVAQSNELAQRYNWVYPLGVTETNSSAINDTISLHFDAVDQLSISVTAIGQCGVSDASSISFGVESTSSPYVGISMNSDTLCDNEVLLISIDSIYSGGLNPEFTWFLNGDTISLDSTSIKITDLNPNDSIWVELKSSKNCVTESIVASTSLKPVILIAPIAEAGPNRTLINLQEINLWSEAYEDSSTKKVTLQDPIYYNWYLTEDTSDIESVTQDGILNANPDLTRDRVLSSPTADTTFYLFEVKNERCKAIDTMIVFINFEIWIPNAFSPNNDGENDVFQIKNIHKFPGNKLEIYNRWGSLVYEKKDYLNTWDGTSDGEELPTSTYFFILDLGDGSDQIAGPVTIVK